MRVLYKRRWVAVTAFVLVFGLVTVYTFTATPLYEARAQVLIENEEANVVNFQAGARGKPDRRTTTTRPSTGILQSRALGTSNAEPDKDVGAPAVSRHRPGARAVVAGALGVQSCAACGQAPPPRALRQAPAADETDAQSRVIDTLPRNVARHAHPQQPPG